MALKELVDQARREIKLPEIHGDRCVHAVIESASCRACVDACPKAAWQLDDDSLGINTEACDGCGLCAPACPESAVCHNHEVLRRDWKGQSLAFSACEYAEVPLSSEGVIPCVHALGERDVLRLYNDGCHQLFVATGDCDACSRGKVNRITEIVDEVNQLLPSRRLSPITISILPSDRWGAMLAATTRPDVGPQADRRGFLRHFVRSGIEQAYKSTAFTNNESHNAAPPGTLLARVSERDVMPYTPVIDAASCNGCDACVRLCPHHAVVLATQDDGSNVYRMHAENCTGCRICVDVCDQNAVIVFERQPQQQHTLDLRSSTCRACGTPYHLPVEQSDGDVLCPICSQVNHHRNLYQVLE